MTTTPEERGTTGPFHRIFSVPGFSSLAASVWLPDGLELSEHDAVNAPLSTQDTAYVYAGGWSSKGHAVDAGFQHSPETDTWHAALNCEAFGQKTDSTAFVGSQWVSLRFWVPQPGHLELVVTGLTGAGKKVTRTLTQDITRFPPQHPRHGQSVDFGWHPSGEGVVLKRMVSIAQEPQNFESGAYVQGAGWTGCRLAAEGIPERPWEAADTGGSQVWPDADRVKVTLISPASCLTTIALGPLPPPA